jgi:predicted DNA-binding transcriptional regulator AlpA
MLTLYEKEKTMSKVHSKSTKSKAETDRRLVSLKYAGDMLGISDRTVRRMCDSGQLPPIVKLGHLSRISYQGILDYIGKLTGKLGSIALL